MNQFIIDDATIIEKFRAAVVAFGQPKVREELAEKEPIIVVYMRDNLLINHVMKAFIEKVYSVDPAIPETEILEISGHIRKGVTVPVASRFRGLTHGQKQKLMAALNEAAKVHKPLLMFDAAQRRWMVNLTDYPTLEKALAWWNHHCLDDGQKRDQSPAEPVDNAPPEVLARRAKRDRRQSRQPQTATA